MHPDGISVYDKVCFILTPQEVCALNLQMILTSHFDFDKGALRRPCCVCSGTRNEEASSEPVPEDMDQVDRHAFPGKVSPNCECSIFKTYIPSVMHSYSVPPSRSPCLPPVALTIERGSI